MVLVGQAAGDPWRPDHLLHRQRRGQGIFAILPALFIAAYPQLGVLNLMQLGSPESAIPVGHHLQRPDHRRWVPLALRGVSLQGLGRASCCAATC